MKDGNSGLQFHAQTVSRPILGNAPTQHFGIPIARPESLGKDRSLTFRKFVVSNPKAFLLRDL